MPLLVATVAYYMFKAGNQPGSLLYVSLGAAVYGIWSSTLFGSGGAIQWQRWQGTLEVLVSAPTPFVLVIAAADARDLRDRDLLARVHAGLGSARLRDPLPRRALACVRGRGAGDDPRPRAARASCSRRPSCCTGTRTRSRTCSSGRCCWSPACSSRSRSCPAGRGPIAWLLAPTWGVQAIREAAIGGTPWPDVGMTISLGLAYLAIGAVCLRHFETAARRHATLSLT